VKEEVAEERKRELQKRETERARGRREKRKKSYLATVTFQIYTNLP
jgi:hypothetical protein